MHHEAQKSTKTNFPLKSARLTFLPSGVLPVKSGAMPPIFMFFIFSMPSTNSLIIELSINGRKEVERVSKKSIFDFGSNKLAAYTETIDLSFFLIACFIAFSEAAFVRPYPLSYSQLEYTVD
jgi:hypothetical protein